MKKRNTLIYTLFAIIALVLLFTNQYDKPANGFTGAPGEGTCADCHTPANSNFAGQVQITGLPDQLYGGQEYKVNIEVRLFRGNPRYAGFEMTVLDDANQDIGNLTLPTGVSGIITDRDLLKTYFKNILHPTEFYTDSLINWSVTWTAPENMLNANVHFYATALLANGDSTAQGDLAVKTQLSRNLTEGGPLTVSIANIDQIQCGGDSTGAISLLVQGGTSPLSYLWSTGATTADIQSLSAGEYSVTVTDSDTSEVILSATLTEPETLIPELISVTGVACNGQDNGGAVLGATGGTPPYRFLWPDADTSRARTGLAAGDYTVLVVDDQGCAASIPVSIEANIFIETHIGSIPESTPGAHDGIAFVKPTGGTPPYLIVWNTGANTDTIRQLAPGNYTVVIGDLSGCLVQDTVFVASGTCPLSASASIQQPNCSTGTAGAIHVNFPSATGKVSVLWSTGDTTSSISDLAPGKYVIHAIDEGTCTFQDTFEINSTGLITLDSIKLVHPQCSGTNDGQISFFIQGGTPPYRLDWNPDLPGLTPDSLAAGTYVLTVFDAQNCSLQDTFELLGDDNTLPFLLAPSMEAFLDETGTTTVTFTQLLNIVGDNCQLDTVSLSRSTFSCMNLGSNRVAITARDEAGNSLKDSINIMVRDTMPPSIEALDTLFANRCSDLNYPMIIAQDNCGVDTIFLLQGIGQEGSFAIGLNLDVYQVIDGSGNAGIGTLPVVVQRPELVAETQAPTCPDRADGSIIVHYLNAPTDISVIWGTGRTGDTLQNIPGGNYIAFAADTTGCFFRDTIVLEASSFRVVLDSIEPASPDGGYLSVHIEGGTPPIDFQWFVNETSLPDTTFTLDSLPAGDYRMKAQDETGCKIVSSDYTIEGLTRRRDLPDELLTIYPNPNHGELWIRHDPSLEIQAVTLTNVLGQIMYRTSSPSLPVIFPGGIPSGFYLLSISTNRGQIVERLFIE